MPFVLSAMLLGGAAPVAAQESRPSDARELEGVWVLNADLSDDLPLLPGEAMAVARASGIVRAQRGPRRGRGHEHAQIVKVRTELRRALADGGRLTFVEAGEPVVLTDTAGVPLTLALDGRTFQLELRGVRVELKAHWDAPLLIVERRFEDGTIVRDQYATFSEPRQLVSTTTIHNGRTREPPVTMRRVYDAIVN